MSQNYDKLKTLQHELFQLDQPDLDFGLYRVMHAKSADKAEIEKELSKFIAGIESAGMDNLENLKALDDTWKVRLIEEDFHRLMFEEGRESP